MSFSLLYLSVTVIADALGIFEALHLSFFCGAILAKHLATILQKLLHPKSPNSQNDPITRKIPDFVKNYQKTSKVAQSPPSGFFAQQSLQKRGHNFEQS